MVGRSLLLGIFRARKELVGKRVGLLLEPCLNVIKALVEVPPQRSGVSRVQGPLRSPGTRPALVPFRCRVV
jgi:hypothetical protein